MLFPSIDNVGPMPFHLHNLILLLHGCKLKGSQDLSVIYLSLFEYFPFKVGPFFYTSTCISFHINILGAFVHSCCHSLLTWTVTWLDLGVNGPPNLKKKKYIYIYICTNFNYFVLKNYTFIPLKILLTLLGVLL